MDPNQTYSREYSRKVIGAAITSLEESIRALRQRLNAHTPISSLPPEVIAAIFSFVRLPGSSPLGPTHKLEWLRVAHVCRQWREIALGQPLFWSHLDFNKVSPAGAAEILARAKKVPLYLEARIPDYQWNNSRIGAIQNGLRAHVSHICHLSISAGGHHLRETLERLVSPAPILEQLSLSSGVHEGRVSVPDNVFGCTTPRLSRLMLDRCNISWKSPLLKGLTHLEIRGLSVSGRPSLPVWLDMLDEMPQLKTLILDSATPVAPPSASRLSGVERTITLPFLVHLDILTSARDCGLALAHLDLPALTLLRVTANSSSVDGDDVREILPYVSRHAHGPQDARPLQSVLISGEERLAHIFAWTDVNLDNVAGRSARLAFIVDRSPRREAWFFDEAMAALPLDNLVKLTAEHHTKLIDKEVWLRHASRWPLLRHVRLVTSVARGFREMLLEDIGGSGRPLLPSLTNLSLVESALTARRTLRLCDALMWRVEQGVPLETLDLRTCLVASSRAVQLLREIVVDVRGPQGARERDAPSRSWDSGARGYFIRDCDSGDNTDSDESERYDFGMDIDEDDYWGGMYDYSAL